MAERFFLLDGAYHQLPAGRSLPGGAVEVPRLPGVGETWNAAMGAFVVDHGIAADLEAPAGHIDTVHMMKALEAAAILSGVTLTHGLLADEADALGVDLNDLAALVHERSAALRETEIVRRCRKTGTPIPNAEP